MKKWQLIILDRDGVINFDSDDYIKSVSEWQAIPGSLEAIAKINQHHIPVVVCTNQSGIARKLFTIEELHRMHEKMQRELQTMQGHVDKIYFCAHHPDESCNCRKPKAGMYLQALQDFNADPQQTLVIGDSLRDIKAAQTAGCYAALVKTGKGERTLAKDKDLTEIPVYTNLEDAINNLLAETVV